MHFLIRKTTNIQNLFTGLWNKSKCQLMKECAKQAWLKTYRIQCLCMYTLDKREKCIGISHVQSNIFLEQCYTIQRSWVQWNVVFLIEKLSRILSGCKHLTLYSLPYIYMLWAGRFVDRIPVGARFSAPVQTGPGAHPAFYTMGIKGKVAWAWHWPSTLI